MSGRHASTRHTVLMRDRQYCGCTRSLTPRGTAVSRQQKRQLASTVFALTWNDFPRIVEDLPYRRYDKIVHFYCEAGMLGSDN